MIASDDVDPITPKAGLADFNDFSDFGNGDFSNSDFCDESLMPTKGRGGDFFLVEAGLVLCLVGVLWNADFIL